jgi:hypothetical protein
MLPKLEEMLGVMHKKWRRILRRGKKPNSSKVNETSVYLNCSESLWTDLVYTVEIKNQQSKMKTSLLFYISQPCKTITGDIA